MIFILVLQDSDKREDGIFYNELVTTNTQSITTSMIDHVKNERKDGYIWSETEVWVNEKLVYSIDVGRGHDSSVYLRKYEYPTVGLPVCSILETFPFDLGCFDRVIDRVRELVGE